MTTPTKTENDTGQLNNQFFSFQLSNFKLMTGNMHRKTERNRNKQKGQKSKDFKIGKQNKKESTMENIEHKNRKTKRVKNRNTESYTEKD